MGQLYRLDFPNGKAYIGITTKTAEVRFKGHEQALHETKPRGQAVYSAWRKHGAPALTVLAIVEDEDLYETEKRAIAIFGTLSPGGYNLTEGGDANPSKHPEVRAKLSAAQRGKNKSPEAIANSAAAQRGRKHSAETRAKMSAAQRGKKKSPEARAKISAALRERAPASAETRAKLSAAHRGMKSTPEARAKMSTAQRARREAEKLLELGIV